MIPESWMSPLNRVRWIRAFRTRAKKVTIRDGRKFNLKYFKWRGEDMVLVTPEIGFVPMGIYRVKKVTDKIWVTESEREEEKNIYLNCLDEFLAESALGGVDIKEQWPHFEGKKESTIRTGFRQAKTRRGVKAENVKVVADEGRVFLVKEPSEDG